MTAPREVVEEEDLELRCPVGPRRLFGILRVSGERPLVTSGNLIEMACQDCRRRHRNRGGKEVAKVLHRFNIVGQLVETEVVYH